MRDVSINISQEMYEVAYRTADKRESRFENRFQNAKLRRAVRDDPRLVELVEGVVGYLGDIAGAICLGLHWKEQLRNLVLRTHLLTHRDNYDLLHRGWTIDVKVEDYGTNHADLVRRIVEHRISREEVYGERLVNAGQFDENYNNEADIYLYSCLDQLDPRRARQWLPVGWIRKDRVRELGKPQERSSAGRRLPSPAYLIPNGELRSPEQLRSIPMKENGTEAPRVQDLQDSRRRDFLQLVLDLGID